MQRNAMLVDLSAHSRSRHANQQPYYRSTNARLEYLTADTILSKSSLKSISRPNILHLSLFERMICAGCICHFDV